MTETTSTLLQKPSPFRLISNHRRFTHALLLAPILILLFDWFFHDQEIGLTVPAAFFALGIAVLLTGRNMHGNHKINSSVIIFFLLALLPAIEDLTPLSFLLAMIGLIILTFAANHASRKDPLSWLDAIWGFVWRIPLRLFQDLARLPRASRRKGKGINLRGLERTWLVPILFTLIFLAIFQSANPLLDQWLKSLDPGHWFQVSSLTHLLVWGFYLILIWPFLHLSRKLYRPATRQVKSQPSKIIEILKTYSLNDKSTLLSLALFNLLFILQNASDIHLLNNGYELPAGYSFSEFAHQGAYALIMATLLAAAFILAFDSSKASPKDSSKDSPEDGTEKSNDKPVLIRPLLYLWVTQTMLLVCFAMLRLKIYIDAYSLTYLRLWLLIWMALVLTGLVLILIKLLRKRSARWLINANIIATLVILYGASLTNFPLFIANHNIEAAKADPDKHLDARYLVELGPYALPALRNLESNPDYADVKRRLNWHGQHPANLSIWINGFEREIKREQANWRQWNFRRARLISDTE
ncbi:DUF4153 domain-containing protein [Cohaesibacter gelatinilyticus]|uniref:Uncharacterized protein n=1 Tax=Cohaesibacter gelatinilyticus TaxID=372072 RepID=A0A285PIW1_9HYPH|nr:DUF4173 domain-containing protein [Cohaesibacter gelatinilyticus]SNZ21197.1 protein of unknown function [Cohaesibacter gelatinilyticus]